MDLTTIADKDNVVWFAPINATAREALAARLGLLLGMVTRVTSAIGPKRTS